MSVIETLVGRESELRTIHELVDGVGERGAALVLRGEPGIGKSALLGEASRYATGQGLTVLSTTAVESEARLPFAGLHQLLRPVLSGAEALPRPQLQPATTTGWRPTSSRLRPAHAAVGLAPATCGVRRPVRRRVRDVHPELPGDGELRQRRPRSDAVHRVRRGPRRSAEGDPAQRPQYGKSDAITGYREFAGRPHFPGAPGWEEVADLALSWAIENADRRPASSAASSPPVAAS